MNENREITNSIDQTETFKLFSQKHPLEDLRALRFGGYGSSFASSSIQSTLFPVPDLPSAITLNVASVDEFKVFSSFFSRYGYECIVCDVRDLKFDGGALYDDNGLPIHAIWRRSVTNDVLDHWDESQDLIEAVRHEAVALIGSFAGHLVHDKQIFEVLATPKPKQF